MTQPTTNNSVQECHKKKNPDGTPHPNKERQAYKGARGPE